VAVVAHRQTTQEEEAGTGTRLVRRGSMARHGDATGSSGSVEIEASSKGGEAQLDADEKDSAHRRKRDNSEAVLGQDTSLGRLRQRDGGVLVREKALWALDGHSDR
jgi:hypothetical protein